MSEKSKSRKSSWNSSSSFRSIDEFRYGTPGIISGVHRKFPIRPIVNILLIIFTTVQVYLLISSRIYLRGALVRTFLSAYVNQENYPEPFNGEQFYINVVGIQDLRDHFHYLFSRVNTIDTDSFVEIDYEHAQFELRVSYRSFKSTQNSSDSIFPIDQAVGIKSPFDMGNTTDIQLFLLKVR
jgi:hypothetical protein